MLRWFDPELFRQWELRAGPVGSAELDLDEGTAPDSVQVRGPDGAPLPAAIHDGRLRFFSAAPGVLHISAGDRRTVYSMTLPAVPTATWKAPKPAPARVFHGTTSRPLWRWLALAAGLLLVWEWLKYGRRILGTVTTIPESKGVPRARRAS